MTALIGGEVSVHFSNPQTSGAFIKAGRVRGLAVTSGARLKAFPDILTMTEAGVPGCEGGPFWGVAAPAKTPQAVIAKLNTEFNRILATTELRRRVPVQLDRKSTRLNSSHGYQSRMPSSA